ncbi:probable cytochrome P450 313b1 [Lutzomyia longipalpis]|uniref:probable cytochrome P450 313b1 n=1 Tax=Lutzomyia longipalpis TaxID=7200 RepID=UPI0024844068|nr:probable cytochrome P450 313b1 [Lutzomyia longipalpis]
MWIYLVIILSALLLHFLWVRKDQYRLGWQMPGPSLWYMIKTICHTLLNTSEGVPKVGMLESIKLVKDHISKVPCRFWFFTDLYVFVIDPEDIQTILNSPNCFDRGLMYEFGDFFAKNGIGIGKMHKWKQSRKTLNPVFSTKACQGYLTIFNEEINVMVSRMKDICRNHKPVDIQYYISALVFSSVYRTMMGKKMYFQMDENYDLGEHIDKILFGIGERVCNPFLHNSALYRLTSLYRAEQKSSNIVFGMAKKIIDEAKAKWLENREELKNQGVNAASKKFPIFVDQIFGNNLKENEIDDKDVFDNIYTMLAAGYETSTVTSLFCILAMAMFPEYQERIFEEIKTTLPNLQDYVEYEDLNKCEFLDRFIKETLRLFPSLPLIVRSVEKATKIGQYTIPAGTQLIIPLIFLHREKSFWGPTADDFDPDRFLPENIEKVNPLAYLPFAGGPKICIGIKYANTFLKTFLINMVKNFKFRTDVKIQDLKFKANLSLKLTAKHLIYVEKRMN